MIDYSDKESFKKTLIAYEELVRATAMPGNPLVNAFGNAMLIAARETLIVTVKGEIDKAFARGMEAAAQQAKGG